MFLVDILAMGDTILAVDLGLPEGMKTGKTFNEAVASPRTDLQEFDKIDHP